MSNPGLDARSSSACCTSSAASMLRQGSLNALKTICLRDIATIQRSCKNWEESREVWIKTEEMPCRSCGEAKMDLECWPYEQKTGRQHLRSSRNTEWMLLNPKPNVPVKGESLDLWIPTFEWKPLSYQVLLLFPSRQRWLHECKVIMQPVTIFLLWT